LRQFFIHAGQIACCTSAASLAPIIKATVPTSTGLNALFFLLFFQGSGFLLDLRLYSATDSGFNCRFLFYIQIVVVFHAWNGDAYLTACKFDVVFFEGTRL